MDSNFIVEHIINWINFKLYNSKNKIALVNIGKDKESNDIAFYELLLLDEEHLCLIIDIIYKFYKENNFYVNIKKFLDIKNSNLSNTYRYNILVKDITKKELRNMSCQDCKCGFMKLKNTKQIEKPSRFQHGICEFLWTCDICNNNFLEIY